MPSWQSGPRGIGRGVDYHFHRPVAMWRELRPLVRDILGNVDATNQAPSERIAVTPTFSMSFINATVPLGARFELAGYADYDRGGWLIQELQRNIRRCVEEKTRKVAPHRHRYRAWWLILLDQIGYAGTPIEAQLLAEQVRAETNLWERVILLDPLDADRAVIIPPAA